MAQLIAKTIALPGSKPPIRFPHYPALERTAVMSFNASIPFSVTDVSTHVMLTRSPIFPLWGDQSFSLPLYYGATYSLANTEGAGATTVYNIPVVDCSGAFWGDSSSGVGTPELAGSVSSAVKKPVFGIDSGLTDVPYVYFPAGSQMLFSVGNAGVAAEATATIEAWVGPGDGQSTNYVIKANTAATTASMGATMLVTTNSWLRVKCVSLELASQVLSFTPIVSFGCARGATPTYTRNNTFGKWTFGAPDSPTTTAFFPLHFNPEYDTSLAPFRNTRLNAVAALFTNTTKVMNKEGTALWGRLAPTRTNPWRVTKDDIQQIHPAEKSFMGLEQGCYAYNPPSTDLNDFANQTFRSYYAVNDSADNNQPVYRLESTAMVCHGFFNDPDGGTSLAINLDYHIEFKTSSTMFQIGVSNLPLEALHQAQVGLLKAGFFFSNWDHTEMIKKIISAVGSLHPLLSVAAPLAHGLLQSSSLASRRTRPTKATSAAASGITLPPRRQRTRKQKSKKKATVSRSKRTVSKALSAMDRIMARQGRPARGV